MASATFKVEFPRRQAMLTATQDGSVIKVPVFVWPNPTQDGRFIVEFEDGKCQMVPAYELTFLGSKELFDQYDWSTDEA